MARALRAPSGRVDRLSCRSIESWWAHQIRFQQPSSRLAVGSGMRALVERQIAGIGDHWQQVCDEAALSAVDRNLLWKRQFLNPDVMVDYPAR